MNILRESILKFFSEKQREILRYWLKSIPAIYYGDDLGKLAQLFGTDKYEHGYTAIYPHYFRWIKNKKLRLLEIGIGGGENTRHGGNSLKMWAKYFSKAQILGIDLYDKSLVDYRRIKTFRGNQMDGEFLHLFSDLDIVIDDGGHNNKAVIFSFEVLFSKLNSGGYYCIEDVENSYWNESDGSESNLEESTTMMNYFKSLTDSLNFLSIRDERIRYSMRQDVQFIHFYPNLIVIRKK